MSVTHSSHISSRTEFTVLWMSRNGCLYLHWVFLSMQNVYISCFLIKRYAASFTFSVTLFFYSVFFFSFLLLELILPCFLVFMFLDLLSLILFIWQKGKLFSLPVVLSSVLMVAIIMALLSRKDHVWLKLTKSTPKKHSIFLLPVFTSNCLAKDSNIKTFFLRT